MLQIFLFIRIALKSVFIGAVSFLIGMLSARSDDMEIYKKHIVAPPNIVFAIASMETYQQRATGLQQPVAVYSPPESRYDPNISYPVPAGSNRCDADKLYVQKAILGRYHVNMPTCGSDDWVLAAKVRCLFSEIDLNLPHIEIQPVIYRTTRPAGMEESIWQVQRIDYVNLPTPIRRWRKHIYNQTGTWVGGLTTQVGNNVQLKTGVQWGDEVNIAGNFPGRHLHYWLQWNEIDKEWSALKNDNYQRQRAQVIHYECADDALFSHGETATSSAIYMRDSVFGPFSQTEPVESLKTWLENKGIQPAALMTANYMHWYHYHNGKNQINTQGDILINNIKTIVNQLDGEVRIGFMQTMPEMTERNDGQYDTMGGKVIYPVNSKNTVTFQNDIFGTDTGLGLLDQIKFNGPNAITELMYEGMLYFNADTPYFGLPLTEDNSGSVGTSVAAGRYISPVQYSQSSKNHCGQNFLVLFGKSNIHPDSMSYPYDLYAQSDYAAKNLINALIQNAPGKNINSCDVCMEALAWHMSHHDLFDSTVDYGKQSVNTYFVGGFDGYFENKFRQGARFGGSVKRYNIFYPQRVSDAINKYSREVWVDDVYRSASTMAISRGSVLKNNNEVFFTFFAPSISHGWLGNLKKYQLKSTGVDKNQDGEDDLYIADYSNKTYPDDIAVDLDSGLIKDAALSGWYLDKTNPDGAKTSRGGLGRQLFNPNNLIQKDSDKWWPYRVFNDDYHFRKKRIYTHRKEEGYKPFELDYRFENGKLISEMSPDVLGVPEGNGEGVFEVIKWLRYQDMLWGVDSNSDQYVSTNSGVHTMAGVIHAEPVIINYGVDDKGTEDRADDSSTDIMLLMTSKGLIHLLNTSAQFMGVDPITGVVKNSTESVIYEESAIYPEVFLETSYSRKRNLPGELHYGMDGDIEFWRYDADDDKQITPGTADFVKIYVNQRRGGRNIFAYDITDVSLPKMLWSILPDDVQETDPFWYMGQSWSKPARHTILFYEEGHVVKKDIVIFGGGYDIENDIAGLARTKDAVGNAIYIVDADTGVLLWWVSNANTVSSADKLELSTMDYSIAADVKIVDVNGDGIADYFFAADLGGQVWQFSFDNTFGGAGVALADRISARLIADVQKESSTTPSSIENNRRFYNSPDVSISHFSENGKPYFTVAVGSGYRAHPLDDETQDAIFVFKLTDETGVLYLDDLENVSDLNLAGDGVSNFNDKNLQNNGWYIEMRKGEKILSESLTADGKLIFSSYVPATNESNNCGYVDIGKGYFYATEVRNGDPVANLHITAHDGNGLTLSDRKKELRAGGIPGRPKLIFPDIDGVSPQVMLGSEIVPVLFKSIQKATYWHQHD